jgi:hypothetical protein
MEFFLPKGRPFWPFPDRIQSVSPLLCILNRREKCCGKPWNSNSPEADLDPCGSTRPRCCQILVNKSPAGHGKEPVLMAAAQTCDLCYYPRQRTWPWRKPLREPLENQNICSSSKTTLWDSSQLTACALAGLKGGWCTRGFRSSCLLNPLVPMVTPRAPWENSEASSVCPHQSWHQS